MTELQVKAKKGSLKKFLATFLAVCLCMTTVHMNGTFVQAAKGDVTVALSTGSVSVKAGGSTEITATLTVEGDEQDDTSDTPNKPNDTGDQTSKTNDVKWEVSNNSATGVTAEVKESTVSSAKVVISTTDKATGKATITVKATVNGKVGTANCEVTVTNEGSEKPDDTGDNSGKPDDTSDVAVETVTIEGEASVEVNKTITLTAKVAPTNATNQTVTWSCKDNTVVSLTPNGKTVVVNGKKVGSTEVTAVVDGKSATKAITVKAAQVNPPVVNPTITGISLDKATASVNKNKTVTLVATVKGTGNFNKAVTWESSNKKVATVDGNGKVKGVAKGTATIKATTADKKFSAECKVTVKVPATKVTVSSNKKVYLVVKKSITIGAAVEPADTTDSVKWSTKNKKIATVSKGKITGKKVGKTTITAKAGSKSAKVEVNVVKKATNATKITLNKKTLKINTGASAALQAKLTPAKATTEVKWSVDKAGKKVVDIKNGIVKGKKAGVATITAKAGKKTAKCVVTVTKAGVKTKLNKAKGTVKVKKTLKITLKGDSKDTIASCTTSNKKIATVKIDKKKKAATITGKKKGTATITVVTKKGAVLTFKATVKK